MGRLLRGGGFVLKDEVRFGRQDRSKRLMEYCQEIRSQLQGLFKEKQITQVNGDLQVTRGLQVSHRG